MAKKPVVVGVIEGCANCAFYLIVGGVCRRFPPIVVSQKNGLCTAFPAMQASGWCGEYKARP